jgi:hypothetical protein
VFTQVECQSIAWGLCGRQPMKGLKGVTLHSYADLHVSSKTRAMQCNNFETHLELNRNLWGSRGSGLSGATSPCPHPGNVMGAPVSPQNLTSTSMSARRQLSRCPLWPVAVMLDQLANSLSDQAQNRPSRCVAVTRPLSIQESWPHWLLFLEEVDAGDIQLPSVRVACSRGCGFCLASMSCASQRIF